MRPDHEELDTIYSIDLRPILGLFNPNNKRQYLQLLKERIDAIGFIFEKSLVPMRLPHLSVIISIIWNQIIIAFTKISVTNKNSK